MQTSTFRPYAILDETRTYLLGIVFSDDEATGLADRVGALLNMVVLEGAHPGGETLLAEELPEWAAEAIATLERAHDFPETFARVLIATHPLLDEELPERRRVRLSAFENAAREMA